MPDLIAMPNLELLTRFLLDIDNLKAVTRRSYVCAGTRLENSAEHSWHLAIAAWSLAQHAKVPVSLEKVLKLALVHDICELDEGDESIYTIQADAKARREQACVTRLMTAYGAVFPDLESLWHEFEAAQTPESKLVRIADRLLPFLHNLACRGKTWHDQSITRAQVLAVTAFIEHDFPALRQWIVGQIDAAVTAGWLKP